MTKKESILDDLDEQLKKLEEELNKIDKDPQAYYDEVLKDDFEEHAMSFRNILNEGKENLEKLKKVGEEELVNVKENIEFTGKALKQSFNYFLSQFKNRKRPTD